MTNIIEEIYRACYIAGKSRYPANIILHMPSQQGKSLTVKRFKGIEGVLHLKGDVTAQAIRKVLDEIAQKDSIENIKLIFIEDYSKLKKRKTVQEDFAGLIGQIVSGAINIEQENLHLSSDIHASVVINVPNQHNLRALERLLIDSGAGNRIMTIELKLTESEALKLRQLGLKKQHKYPITQTAPFNDDYGEIDNEFITAHSHIKRDTELAFIWACSKVRKGLYEDIKKYQLKPINKLDVEGYWDES